MQELVGGWAEPAQMGVLAGVWSIVELRDASVAKWLLCYMCRNEYADVTLKGPKHRGAC